MNTKQMVEEIVYRNHIINLVVGILFVAFLVFCTIIIIAEHRERMKLMKEERERSEKK